MARKTVFELIKQAKENRQLPLVKVGFLVSEKTHEKFMDLCQQGNVVASEVIEIKKLDFIDEAKKYL